MTMVDGFKYLVLTIYVILTLWLSYVGMRKAKDMKGYAIGNKDMGPYLVGITMAASIASTSTFVINPGFVYVHGVSAFIHFGISAWLGIAAAFFTLMRRFRAIGAANGAITIPDWIYQRYQNRKLSLFFALINLLTISFVVLILVGCSILFSQLFGVDQKLALILVAVFVFGYVFMGGAYAHAYTNAVQGVMMLFVTVILLVNGFQYFDAGVINSLENINTDYASLFNPNSSLYYDLFSVFISSFIVSFALMLQPHILTKVLYLKDDTEVRRFMWTALVMLFVFLMMLVIGFYARLSGLEVDRQDTVVAQYIFQEFQGSQSGQLFLTFVTVALLAAGMSTLDGILVALSTMVVRDVYVPLRGVAARDGLWLSRFVLIAIGLLALVLAWNPPALVGLFAQKGVYGLAVASVVPLLLGILNQNPIKAWVVAVPSLGGVAAYLLLLFGLQIANPSVAAAWAILWSVVLGIATFITSLRMERSPLVGELDSST